MKNTLPFIMLCLASAQPFLAHTQAPEKQLPQESMSVPSVANVISNYVKAIGGTPAWDKLRTQLAKGTYENDQWGPGTNALEIFRKVPNKWLFAIRGSDGGTLQQGFNGKVGWAESGELSEEQVALFERLLGLRAGVELPKLLPKMKPVVKTKTAGKEVFTIELPLIGDNLEKLYFDAKSGLLIQEDFGGASLHYEDYKTVDGVKVPFTIRQDGSPNWTIKFKEIKHNVPIEDAKFDRPKNP